ncbi:MAG: hypothetical protein ACI8S6_005090, partial [Myxococcota bacterium]
MASWRLLSTMPSDITVEHARARSALQLDQPLGLQLWSAILTAASPTSLHEERLSVGELLLSRGRVEEAAPLLAPLLDGTSDASSAALWASASASSRRGDLPEAIAQLEQWLQRYPAGRERASVESLLSQSQLQQGRRLFASDSHAAARTAYDALVLRDPRSPLSPDAAYEAALSSRALSETDDFLRRLRELRARWPNTSAASRSLIAESRHLSFDQNELEVARAFLREHASEGGASSELSRLDSARIQAHTSPASSARDATVEVITRNLTSVEVRVHRIDTEAFLRAGGRPSALPDLDVAVIAPDLSFRHEITDASPGRDVISEIPLPLRERGLYAITVASTDREARTVLSVGALSVLARAAGPDLAIGVLSDGRPASGARVLLSTSSGITVHRADRSGLVRTQVPAGEVVILAESTRGVGMLELPRGGGGDPSAAVSVSADLDRAVYLPGDEVGLRAVSRREGTPLTGKWRLWIELGGAQLSVTEATSDSRGAVVASFSLPLTAGDETGRIIGLPPGEDVPVSLGLVRIVHPDPVHPRLTASVEGSRGEIRVERPGGGPAAGARVRWSSDMGQSGVGETGADGILRVKGPTGLRWSLSAELVGAPLAVTATESMMLTPPEVWLLQDRLRLDEPGALKIHSADAVTARIRVLELLPTPELAPAPLDPWVPSLKLGLDGEERWSGLAPEGRSISGSRPVWSKDVEVSSDTEASVALPGLPEGEYRVELVWQDGRHSESLPLSVTAEDLRLEGAAPVAVGESVRATASGSAALVTIESGEILAAALLKDGQALSSRVTAQWGDSVDWIATGTGGVHARSLPVDGALSVTVERTVLADGRWQLTAQVSDGAGRPASAQVALQLIDTAVAETHGTPQSLNRGILRAQRMSAAALGGKAGPVRHGADATLLSAALLEEAVREQAAQRAARADSGSFDNRLTEMLGEDLPFQGGLGSSGYGMGAGGLGTTGRGSGSVGYGRGSGSIGGLQVVRGVRQRVAWSVQETDRQGTMTLTIDAPRRGARWELRASALTDAAAGQGTTIVDDRARSWVIAPVLAAAGRGDTVQPRLEVVNGTSEALNCKVTDGSTQSPLVVSAGASSSATLSAIEAGGERAVSVRCGGAVIYEDVVTVPLAEGEGVWTAASGPGGALPLSILALDADPALSRQLDRAAISGRAALAALPWVTRSERAALEAQVARLDRTIRAQLARQVSAGTALEVLHFYADAGARLSLPAEQQARLIAQLGAATGLSERIRAARVRVLLGEAADP